MKVPSCVIWGLTKNSSAFKVSRPGAKSRKCIFNSNPTNLTNLHNQSACSNSIGLNVTKGISKTKKSFRREYTLQTNTVAQHKTTVVTKQDAVHNGFSTQTVKAGTARTAKVIKSLIQFNDAKKTMLYKRLGKLHAASVDHAKGSK